MFGIGEEFTYDKCSCCSSLQLRDVPFNLSKYYPEGYYSEKADTDSYDEGARFIHSSV